MNIVTLLLGSGSFTSRFETFEQVRAFKSNRIKFLRNLGRMLSSGKGSVPGMLTATARRTPDASLSVAFISIREHLKSGAALHAALAPYYTPLESALIESTNIKADSKEQRGEGFITVANMMKHLQRNQSGIGKLLFDVVTSAAVVAAAWLGIGLFAAEQFELLVKRESWPAISQAVIGAGEFVLKIWPISLVAILGAAVAVIWALPNWCGEHRKWCDQHLPGFKLYRLIQAAPIQLALGTFMAAGLGFEKALTLLEGNTSKWGRSYLSMMRQNYRVKRGIDIVDVGLFDWESMVMVEVRSFGGDLAEALQYVSIESAPELSELLAQRLAAASILVLALQKLALVVVALSVGLIFIASLENFGKTF